jgi:hypothetical protein
VPPQTNSSILNSILLALEQVEVTFLLGHTLDQAAQSYLPLEISNKVQRCCLALELSTLRGILARMTEDVENAGT